MEFYVYLNGAKRGPLTEERVQALLAEGVLHGSDLASAESSGAWKALAAFRRFHAPTAEEPPAGEASESPPLAPLSAPRPHLAPVPAPAARHLSPIDPTSLGPYARSTLGPNENPCYRTTLHWIIFARFAGLATLVFLLVALPFAIGVQALTGSELGWFVLPLPAFLMVPPTLAFASSELVITDRRVLIKTGIVRRQTMEVFISKVESIAVDQGFFGRVLDYGTVVIRGTGGFEELFEAIASPIQFRNWVQRLQGGAPEFAKPTPP
ncbi:MAG: PH domain-containing protein [Chthoniobacterales bacterium]|nr:PH domain-containing protein [Chthoniobacterales bacterium]